MLDKASPIRDFYPDSWDIDRNGKKQEWKSILKLPFVDNTRLVHTLKPVWDDQTKWTSEEKARNATGFAKLMVSNKHPLFKELYKFAVTPNDPRRPEVRSTSETTIRTFTNPLPPTPARCEENGE